MPRVTAPVALAIGLGMSLWLPSSAHAQWAGSWNAGATRIRVTIESWGPDCGPRPRSSTVPAAGRVRITQSGDHLIVHGREQRRTDRCWSDNQAVRRISSSYREGVWSTTCRTGQNDPRSETGTYVLRGNGDNRLDFTDRSRYDWQLNESRCVGSIISTQTFTRVVASSPTQPTPTPTPDPRPPPASCDPGPPARLRLQPAESEIEPGERVRFRALVTDARGCPVRGRTVHWELTRPAGVTGELSNGVFQSGQTAAEAEGDFVVVAQSGSARAEARVAVRTPDLSDLIARRTGGGIVQARDDEDATVGSTSGVDAQTPQESDGGLWLWGIVGAATVLLLLIGLLAIVIVIRRRSSPTGPGHAPMAGVLGVPPTEPAAAPTEAAEPTAGPSPTTGSPAPSGTRACPKCGERYADAAMGFCARDGTPLVDAPRASEQGQPLICPACRRGFAQGTASCPADGAALMPYARFVEQHKALEKATQGPRKMCPKCGTQYGQQVTFCGRDGADLVLVD